MRHISNIIVILEADGTVRYVTLTFEKVFGSKAEELTGLKIFSFVHSEVAEWVKQTFSEVLRSSAGQPTIEFRLLHADDSWRHVETVSNNLLTTRALAAL